jgi:hypothetical protein
MGTASPAFGLLKEKMLANTPAIPSRHSGERRNPCAPTVSWDNPLDRFAVEPYGSTPNASGRVDGFRRGDGGLFIQGGSARQAGVNSQ